METTARLVFETLMGIYLPYSMGLLFLDAQILGLYGVWGMAVARTAGWRRAWVEVAGLATLGFAIVNAGLGAPRPVLPPVVVLAGVALLWAGLAQAAERWPMVWLPWLIGAGFWWGPPHLFLPGSIWLLAAAAWLAAKIRSSHED